MQHRFLTQTNTQRTRHAYSIILYGIKPWIHTSKDKASWVLVDSKLLIFGFMLGFLMFL